MSPLSGSRFKTAIVLGLLPGLVTFQPAIHANPSGGLVIDGMAEIGDGLGGHLSVFQSSDRAIINWEQFSIAAGEITEFIQPGASSAVLNRVVTGNPSAILGALRANGNVFVINPNGIMVGPSGSIDVNGLVMSTLDLDNAQFMAGGDMLFKGTSQAGIENYGRINGVGGDVFLMAHTVTNAGSISAAQGTVGIGAGQEVLLTATPDANGERVFVRPGGSGGGTGIQNVGSIEGAAVELKAHGNMYALAINNGGSVRATGVGNRGGQVYLRAVGGQIDNTGAISATLPGGNGGRILIEAAMANLGGTIDASAVGGSHGGEVNVVAERINVTGTISANGEIGGTVQLGGSDGELQAKSITVGAGAQLSANGLSQGGSINLKTDRDGLIDIDGMLSALGSSGNGGTISVLGGAAAEVSSTAVLDASGGQHGGTIVVDTVDGVTNFAGQAFANGGDGAGGTISVLGDEVNVLGTSRVEANGDARGGTIQIGGAYQGGDPKVHNAKNTTVANRAVLSANGTGESSTGGQVIVWANETADFQGEISATGQSVGGFAEVSGKRELIFGGGVDLSATEVGGTAGHLLLDPSDYLIQNGTAASGANQMRAVNLAALLNNQSVTIRTTGAGVGTNALVPDGNILVEQGANVLYGSSNHLTLIAYNDIDVRASIQNAGDGHINLAAGVDDTISFNDTDLTGIFGTSASYGQRQGTVYIGERIDNPGGNNDLEAGAVVGSRSGNTNIAAFGLELVSGDANGDVAQIGWHDQGVRSGQTDNILRLENSLTNAKLTDVDYEAEAWYLASNPLLDKGNGATGNITIEVKDDLLVTRRGTLPTVRSYSIIGHGGHNQDAAASGGDFSGDITIRTGMFGEGSGDVNLIAGSAITASTDDSILIGHGGRNNDGNQSGNILIDTRAGTSGNVSLLAGQGLRQFVQIGHGSHDNNGATKSGSIEVLAKGDIKAIGGVRGPDQINTGVDPGYSYAQIGHGGYNADSDITGGIVVTSDAGSILFQGGSQRDSFVQLGHGGATTRGMGLGFSGDITVSAAREISFIAGTFDDNQEITNEDGRIYAQIGHGGWDTDINQAGTGQYTGVGHNGDIRVTTSDGSIYLLGGDHLRAFLPSEGKGNGVGHYAQIGHGGRASNGDHTGDVIVSAGGINSDVYLAAGSTSDSENSDSDSGARIGHGGRDSSGNHGARDESDVISVTAGRDIVLDASNAGPISPVQIGNGGRSTRGDHFAQISIEAGRDVILLAPTGSQTAPLAGEGRFASYGFGAQTTAALNADLNQDRAANLADGADVTFSSHSRVRQGSIVITIRLDSGVILGTASDAANPGVVVADNDITADFNDGLGLRTILAGDTIALVSYPANPDGAGSITFTQDVNPGIAGTLDAFSTIPGDTGTVNVFIQLEDFDQDDSYVMIGNGGIDADFPNNNTALGTRGNISVIAGRNVDLLAGNDDQNFAQIGNGGRSTSGAHTGDISVVSGGKVTLQGGRENLAYAQIGNGGQGATGNSSGAITVTSATGVDLFAGSGSIAYAMIGNGGDDADTISFNGHSGIINVTSTSGDIRLRATQSDEPLDLGSATSDRSFALIGNGGGRADGNHNGAITVNALNGSIELFGSSQDPLLSTGNEGFAQIGNGGYISRGDQSGPVTVLASGDLILKAGNRATSYAQIGNGGDDADNPNSSGSGNLGATGKIVVTTGGDLTATGGSNGNNYAQIGNGGFNNQGDHDGEIVVSAGGAITFSGGNSNNTYVQIGHGGSGANGNHSGNVTVLSVGDLTFTAGQSLTVGDVASAQIGHGGEGNNVVQSGHSGNLFVESSAGSISFTAGTRDRAFALLGHGGVRNDGSHIGNIHVAAANDIRFSAGTNTRTWKFAQLGHGGIDSQGSHSGDIFVNAGRALLVDADTGGLSEGSRDYAKIGHGGYSSSGNHTGFITVLAGSGGVSVRGGSTFNDQFAQIGHGGILSSGNLAGSISVVTSGDIAVTAGTGDYRGAIIGHGDPQRGNTNGTRTGGLNVYADGTITLTDGTATSGAYISHQTSSGAASISYAGSGVTAVGDQGYSIISGGGLTFNGTEQLQGTGNGQSLAEAIIRGLLVDKVTIASGGATTDFDLGALNSGGFLATALGSYTNGNALTFAAGRDLLVPFSIQNRGSGHVNLLAGWDSDSTGSFAAPTMSALTLDPFFAAGSGIALGTEALPDFSLSLPATDDGDEYGQHDGIVRIGTVGQAVRTVVGSRLGTTSVFGHGVVLNASNTTANAGSQIGYFTDATGPANGAIQLALHDAGVTLNGGSVAGAYTQIGHGGFNATAATIDAPITISFFEAGIVDLNGGSGTNAFAQIGNGTSGTTAGTLGKSGAISITNFSDVTLDGLGTGAYAQIGNGAAGKGGTLGGDIILTGNTEASTVTLLGGSSSQAYAQIGHGGEKSTSAISGASTIAATDAIVLTGGDGLDAYAQIGAGGANSTGTKNVGPTDVTGGSLVLNGGNLASSYAQIGSGGRGSSGTASGDIRVNSTAGSVTLNGGLANEGYAQIGNGGSRVIGNKSGNLRVQVTGGDLVLNGGAAGSLNAYAQIGHGGNQAFGPRMGAVGEVIDIDVFSGSLALNGGAGNQASAVIGTGGIDANSLEFFSLINVDVNGNIFLKGGSGALSQAQIGSGGTSTDGVKNGDILVNAGNDLSLSRGTGGNSGAKIGHGDYLYTSGGSGSGTGVIYGDIQVTAGEDITLDGSVIGVDSRLSTPGGDGDVIVAASRNRPTDLATGGAIIADALSAFGSQNAGVGELRLYAPSRAQMQIANGARLNLANYTGTPIDPAIRRGDERIAHSIDFATGEITDLDEHQNLDPQYLTNLSTNRVVDSSVYSPIASLGNYNLFFDTITEREVVVIDPDPTPVPTPGGGAAGGGSGTGDGSTPPSIAAGGSIITGTDAFGNPIFSFGPLIGGGEGGFVFQNGVISFNPNGDGEFMTVGGFLSELLDSNESQSGIQDPDEGQVVTKRKRHLGSSAHARDPGSEIRSKSASINSFDVFSGSGTSVGTFQ